MVIMHFIFNVWVELIEQADKIRKYIPKKIDPLTCCQGLLIPNLKALKPHKKTSSI